MSANTREHLLLTLSPQEIRPPHCLLEDLGMAITVVPQRCLYLSDIGIDGYHLQRGIDGFDKEPALLKHSVAEWAAATGDAIAVVDLGAGDGCRVKPILKVLSDLGKRVEYWAIDVSSSMLARNRATVEPLVDVYQAEEVTWEALSCNHSLRPQKRTLWLLLGNTYQGFEPEQMLPFLASLLVSPGDLLYVGCDTWKTPNEKQTLVARDLLKYSNEQMRCGFLKLLGVKLEDVRHNVMWNEARHQFEMYVCVMRSQKGADGLTQGDILLMGVGRRMERRMFGLELSRWFKTRILHDERVDRFLTIVMCSKR